MINVAFSSSNAVDPSKLHGSDADTGIISINLTAESRHRWVILQLEGQLHNKDTKRCHWKKALVKCNTKCHSDSKPNSCKKVTQ